MLSGKSSLFYLWWNFTKEKSLCKNSGLDSRPDSGKYRPVGTMGKKFKKGVDFVLRRRYNVCLYGKLTQGGEIHAQHQVLQEGCHFFQDRL